MLVAQREAWRWRHGQDKSSHDCEVEKRYLICMRQDGQVLYVAHPLICHFLRFWKLGLEALDQKLENLRETRNLHTKLWAGHCLGKPDVML